MKPVPAKSCPSCGERYEPDVLFCPRDGTPLATARPPSSPNVPRAGAATATVGGTLVARDPYLGLELAGQIRLKHLIGIGSMGRVYRAFQAGIERDVAVKILHRELSGNAELVSRFHREAKVASRLTHPNVVQLLMTGVVPTQSSPPAEIDPQSQGAIGGELYLVMEHLDGISLLSALAAAGTGGEGSALPLTRALHIAIQICDAVGEAHKQGIVHRDIKPENVMLVRRGDDAEYVKVLDFGIARMNWGDTSMASTQAGLIFGTAKYISPEGAEGQPVGPPADVYAIATILFQMLAGRTPFEGDSPVALLVQHTHAPPPDLASIARASYVPRPIVEVVMQNLGKRAADRAQNARVLGRELVAAARDAGLDPDEIIATSTLAFQRGKGAVKLPSKERTRQHELSAELAARIGGIPAKARRGDAGDTEDEDSEPPPRSRRVDVSPLPAAPSAGRRDGDGFRGERTLEGRASPSSRGRSLARSSDPGRPARAGRRQTPVPPAPRRSAPARATRADLDFDDARDETRRRGAEARRPAVQDDGPADGPADVRREPAVAAASSTMQGTETTLTGAGGEAAGRGRRSRLARGAAFAILAALTVMLVVLGGRRLGGFGASASEDSVEAQVEAARDCMRRRAWDTPAGARLNVKEITDAAMARWPDDPRVIEVRREAAERMLSDALGRKYTGATGDAVHLARLALELHPQLTAAQQFVAELEPSASPSVAPADASADPAAPRPQGGKRLPPPRASASAEPAAGPPSSAPSASAAPVLPPQPPPLPAGHAPPSSSGPWL